MFQSSLFNLKDLSLEDAAISASTRLGGAGSSAMSSKDFKKMTIKELKTLLDSNNEIKLKNAMKSIAYKQATGTMGDEKAISLYTYVLKNVNCQDLKTKRMCYDFLITYMPLDDSAAYLAMNSVQQLLHYKEPEARELALTVLSKFKSKAALPLILQFSKDTMSDFDFKVRRVLSLNFRSCWEQNVLSDDDLAKILTTLLQDANYSVVSSCIPLLKDLLQKNDTHFNIIHGFYKRFIRDLDLFEDYCFKDLLLILKIYNSKFVIQDSEDYICFLKGLEKLLIEGDSPTKILESVKTLIAYKSTSNQTLIIDSFLAALSLNYKFNDAKQQILELMLYISSNDEFALKHVFSNEYESLALSLYDDSEEVQSLKIQILATNITEDNVDKIFKIFQRYAKISNLSSEMKSLVLNGIAECCKIDPLYNSKAMSWIVKFMKSPICESDIDVNNAAFSLIRGITTQNSVEDNLPAVYLLTKALLTKKNSDDMVYGSDLFADTKAGIIWLVGDYSAQNLALGAEVLKKLLPTFAFEDKNVRLQILTLAAKIYCHYKNITEDIEPDNVYQKMFESILELCKFDSEYDIIDRARMFAGLLNKCGNEISQLLLQAPKNVLTFMNINNSISLSVKKELQLPSVDNGEIEDASELRNNEIKIRDFSKKNSSMSSADFVNHGFKNDQEEKNTFNSRLASSDSSKRLTRTDEYVSVKNRRDYELKTMEDFFAEESVYKAPKRKVVKKIIVQEESDDDDDSEEESDDDDSEEESGDDDSEEESNDEEEGTSEEDEETSNEENVHK